MAIKYTTNNYPCRTYKALLTQTGSLGGTDISAFDYRFIIGESYAIATYNAGDDFSNIANVTSGTINTSGCVFIATGYTPTNWSNGSLLGSEGGLIVDVLENTLGFKVDWAWAPFGGNGYYVAINSDLGPTDNTFPIEKTMVSSSVNYPYQSPYFMSTITGVGSYGGPGTNDAVFVDAMDMDTYLLTDNLLYYTPVTITIHD